VEDARRDYGVILKTVTFEVDTAATQGERAGRRTT
jgi:hypothetical protein